MRRPFLGVLALFALAACALPATPSAVSGSKAAPPLRFRRALSLIAPARFFQGLPEEHFWVTHDDKLDRVLAASARLELSPTGQVLAAGWDADLLHGGEGLLGSLAVPASQGGGYVHWSRARLFRSREFTSELLPVQSPDANIRGARPGLASVMVVTDAAVRELLPGSRKLTSIAEPGIIDAAALDASHAVRLDVFGRASTSIDGGKSWIDLSPTAGIAVRSLTLGERELMIDTWQGRFVVGADGKLNTMDPMRGYYDPARFFQIAWKTTRAAEREEWPFGYREVTPLGAVILSGSEAAPGVGVGVIQGVAVRVDLPTGKLVSYASDWIPSGLQCQPLSADDGVLFACMWERYQGYGGYVLRATGDGPPEPERTFTDDGGFVADDDGALGFTGSCRTAPRLFDPEDVSRAEPEGDAPLQPVFCVRKSVGLAPGAGPEWVERSIDLAEGSTLIAWVPRKDGTAAALVLSNDPLPEASRGAVRVTEQAGVRVVRLYREIETYPFSRSSYHPSGRGYFTSVDKRFAARDDGSIDGWLSQDAYQPIQIGVTIAPDGRPELHEMPPGVAMMTVTGDFGVAISSQGDLHETTDHGRSWRSAGTSPIPPSSTYNAGGCSALGCSLGPVVRLGWGEAKLAPRIGSVSSAPPLPEPSSSAPRLQCRPTGSLTPLAPPPASPSGTKHPVTTPYGDTLDLVQEQAAPEPVAPNPGYPPGMAFPPGMPLPPGPATAAPLVSAAPAAGKPPRASPAVLRTHSLLFRLPFEPSAPLRRLNATDASFSTQRRTSVIPLLAAAPSAAGRGRDANGEVSLLILGDTSELLVSGDRITSQPAFEPRRYTYSDNTWAGLSLPSNHAIMIGELRRRLALEEHGASPPPPPLYIGVDRDSTRRRAMMTLGRRDDGGLGVLVFDGNAPQTVGVAGVDLRGEGLRPITKLAPWSSVVTADDPRCMEDRDAYRALVILDPSGWFELDQALLPGVTFARQGMALVRWGKDRVCLEALDAAAIDNHRRAVTPRTYTLVIRWTGKKGGGPRSAAPGINAALRDAELREDLRCSVEPATQKTTP